MIIKCGSIVCLELGTVGMRLKFISLSRTDSISGRSVTAISPGRSVRIPVGAIIPTAQKKPPVIRQIEGSTAVAGPVHGADGGKKIGISFA